jgi:multidrug efflux pump subunit AcrA (membrane-fusion protein)
MKNIFSKIKNLAQKNKWWTVLIILVVIIILFVFLGKKKENPIEFITVEKHNIIEEVSVTGNVKPLSDLDLSFETSGQVSRVAVSAGDKVYQGQYLASLSNADLSAEVEQAKAGLKIAQANLSSGLMTSKSSLDDALVTLSSKIADAYTKADDAIGNGVDQMFNSPRTDSAKINIILNDSQLENDINISRYELEFILNDWKAKSSTLPIDTAYSYLDKIKIFLDKVASGINGITSSSNISQTTLDKYKAAISEARASIALAYSNLNIANTAYNSAKLSYDLNISKNTPETLSVEEATVEQAKANVLAAQANLSKSIIISPINGVISNINAKVGQTMQSGASAISVISYGQYEVESYIPEADIAKVKVGNVATTTLDAYGSDTFFDTSVIKIDPAETIISGVPTYKVTLKFASSTDSRIKSGMTANLDILTAQRNNVIAIPSRSIYSVDSAKYVKLMDSKDKNKTIETKITTGIRGVDGYIEIISGLKEGDKVVSSTKF